MLICWSTYTCTPNITITQILVFKKVDIIRFLINNLNLTLNIKLTLLLRLVATDLLTMYTYFKYLDLCHHFMSKSTLRLIYTNWDFVYTPKNIPLLPKSSAAVTREISRIKWCGLIQHKICICCHSNYLPRVMPFSHWLVSWCTSLTLT